MFRDRKLRVTKTTQRVPIEEHHTAVVNRISQNEKTLQRLIAQREDLQTKIQDTRSLAAVQKLQEALSRTNNRIHQIQDQASMTQYYLRNSRIFRDYFDNETPRQAQGTSRILQALHIADQAPANNNQKTREELFEDYLANVNENFVPSRFFNNRRDTEAGNRCDECGGEMKLDVQEALFTCDNCGKMTETLLDTERPSYKEPPKDVSYFNYKRANHMKERLAQVQGKEATDISEEIINAIIVECKKQRITNLATLTQPRMRAILKKLGFNDKYEHAIHIINRLNGLPPPRLSPESEQIVCNMFDQIQVAFIRHCPANRKNFLSYNFVM